jgi:hypothetical protein
VSKTAVKRWRLANPIMSKYYQLRDTAKLRGLLVTITKDDYAQLITKPCHYCGGFLPSSGHGIDRIDSSFGYIPDNCRPCCSVCNYAKRAMSEVDFKTWIVRVYEQWAKT